MLVVPRLQRSRILAIRLPALPGWADFGYRPSGPGSDLRFIAGSHSLSGLGLLLAVPVRQTQGRLFGTDRLARKRATADRSLLNVAKGFGWLRGAQKHSHDKG
jgi:hypothetical protein